MERLRFYIRLYHKAFDRYTPQILLIVVLSIVSSALEGVGISAIIPVFSFVNGAGGLGTDAISQFIAGTFAFLHITYTFRLLIAFIAILFVARVLFVFAIRIITARIIYSYERDLREALFSKTLAARWPYLSQQHIGNLEQLLTTNTTNASQFFGNISTSVMVASKVIMYIAIAVNLSWWVAIVSAVSGIIVLFVLQPIFKRTRIVAYDAEKTNRALAHFVSEHVIGMKAIKAMALEEPVVKRGRTLFERMRFLNMRSIMLRSYVELVVQFAAVAFVGLVFTIMYRSGSFSLAAFGVIVYAIGQIFNQVQAAQLQLHTIGAMLPYIAEAHAYMERTEASRERTDGAAEFILGSGISFKNVSFSYPGREGVLKNISFEIPAGSLVGISGPSGAGKTTIADLLLRLVEPTSGDIEAGGKNVDEIPLSLWRTHVGYVPQDAVLLNDTIKANITFYDHSLSHGDVVAACRNAHIHKFVESLPDKYETVIGERGILLSGGQRQRIALARVLARKPSLLVLDEATSSLDHESERAIQEAIENLRGHMTVVVIAHRATTVTRADRIIVLRDGKIQEQGTPEELLARKSSYFASMVHAEPHTNV